MSLQSTINLETEKTESEIKSSGFVDHIQRQIIRKERNVLLLEMAEKTLGTEYVRRMYPNFYEANKRF